MLKIRAKITLERGPTGYMDLKRWKEEEGFYIEYTSHYQDNFPTIEAKGKTLKECFDNYDGEDWYDKTNMFTKSLADRIIETFKLSDEDIKFIRELGERGDF